MPTVTAAGSDQAGATELTADNNLVTTANEGEGVKVPSFVAGEVWVCNGTSVTVFVYPTSGGKLNNAPMNVALLLEPQAAAIFKAISALDCIVVHC